MRRIALLAAAALAGAAPAPAAPRLVVQLGHSADVESVAATPDGKRLVSATADGEVVVWDRETGRELLRRGTFASADGSAYMAPNAGGRTTHVALSADGSVAALGFHETIAVYDLKTGRDLPAPKIAALIVGPKKEILPVLHLALTADGKHLQSAFDTVVCTTAVADGTVEASFPHGHGAGVWLGDAGHLVHNHSFGKKAYAGFWDVAAKREVAKIFGLPQLTAGDRIWLFADGREFAFVEVPAAGRKATGTTVSVWDVATHRQKSGVPPRPEWEIDAVGASPDRSALILAETRPAAKGGTATHALRVVETASGKDLAKPFPVGGRPTHVGLIDGGKTAWASFGAGKGVAVATWHVADGKAGPRFRGLARVPTDLTFSADGKRLVTMSEARHARTWDLQAGRPDPRFDLDAGDRIESILGLTPAGDALIRAKGLLIRDLTGGRPDVRLPEGIRSAALAPDGHAAAAITEKAVELRKRDGSVRHVIDGDFVHDTRDGTKNLSVRFSDDGKRLLAIRKEIKQEIVSVWDAGSGKKILSFAHRNDRDQPFELALSPDGGRLAAMAPDVVEVWDAASGHERSHRLSARLACAAVFPRRQQALDCGPPGRRTRHDLGRSGQRPGPQGGHGAVPQGRGDWHPRDGPEADE